MNTIIEVPLWVLAIFVVLSWSGFYHLGHFFGTKILGPILLYSYLFFIGQKIYSIDIHGNRIFKRVRGFKSIHIFHIIKRIQEGMKK